jgi:hypothetical protein
MSLNDIRLPASVIAGLYPSSLVDTGTAEVAQPIRANPVTDEPPGQATAAPAWKYLGDNRKNVLVIVDHADVLHLPDEELSFLTNILTACKLDLGDVAIVNKNNHPQSSCNDYLGFFSSRIVLLFGVDPARFGLPVDFPPFQVQSVAGCTFLYSLSLDERHQDTLFKSKLWVCLKRIFGV